MPEEILNPSDFHVGWSAQSLAGDIYVIVKATDKTVTFDKYDTVWLTVRRVRRKRFEWIEGGYFKDGASRSGRVIFSRLRTFAAATISSNRMSLRRWHDGTLLLRFPLGLWYRRDMG